MRRFFALARSAALEALAEPISVILFLVAFLMIHLAPVFHYHQFGEVGRLPRECGFSALLMFGLVFATASAMRVVGGEITRGTAAMALVRPISRSLFLGAKIFGVVVAFGLFMIGVGAATLLAVCSSTIGAHVAECCEGVTVSRIWPLGLLLGVLGTLAGFIFAALGNRFKNMRFCVTGCVAMTVAQVVAVLVALAVGAGHVLPWRILPAFGVLALGCVVVITFAGAMAVVCKPAVTAGLVGVMVVSAFVFPLTCIGPRLATFWQVEKLAGNGALVWADIYPALFASISLTVFWLIVGTVLLQRRELP